MKFNDFNCPKWDDIPDYGIRSKEVIRYIEENFENIIIERPIITSTMIQNYRRWGLIKSSEGRLYDREDIAKLITITIYKQVISINNIKKGMDLALKQLSTKQSYNSFADNLTKSITSLETSINENGDFTINQKIIESKKVGLSLVGYSYALKLLANIIIEKNGIKNLRSKNE